MVGIVTWHYYTNFGSALQCYALSNTISKLGYRVQVINYRNPKYLQSNRFLACLKGVIESLFGLFPPLRFRYGQTFKYFLSEAISQSRLYTSSDEIKKDALSYSTIVAGSDQIWAPNVFNPVYMIDFVDGKKVNKVSYAASIGLNEIPEKYVGQYSSLLGDFTSLAVREEEGARLLKDRCGIVANIVLDPTLLVNVAEYRALQSTKYLPFLPSKYIFCYFLNKKHTYKARVEEYAKKNGFSVVGWSAKPEDSTWMTLFQRIGPREFLYLIDHAECIITDSYHGTIFSMLHHKSFFTFQRFAQTDPICQNSRIRQLNSYFHFDERIVVDQNIPSDLLNYDYNSFEEILCKEREKSMNYLKQSLK